MSELKVRNSANEAWQIIETQRTKVRKTPTWKWAAHRGAFLEGLPENTIPALIRAKERGFGYCECDVQITSDSVAVISHDATITGRNTDGVSTTLTIAESTAADVCSLIVGSRARFGHIHPTTLDEFLNTAYYIGIDVIIHGGKTADAGKLIAQAVVRNGMVGRVIYLSHFAAAEGIASVDRQAKFEVCTDPTESNIDQMAAIADKFVYCGYDMRATTNDISATVELARAAGFGVSFWDVSTANVDNCLKYKPTAITLWSDTDNFHAWEKEYLDSVKLW